MDEYLNAMKDKPREHWRMKEVSAERCVAGWCLCSSITYWWESKQRQASLPPPPAFPHLLQREYLIPLEVLLCFILFWGVGGVLSSHSNAVTSWSLICFKAASWLDSWLRGTTARRQKWISPDLFTLPVFVGELKLLVFTLVHQNLCTWNSVQHATSSSL